MKESDGGYEFARDYNRHDLIICQDQLNEVAACDLVFQMVLLGKSGRHWRHLKGKLKKALEKAPKTRELISELGENKSGS
jgi:hypothetical protein